MKTFYVAISFLLAFLAVALIAGVVFSQMAESPQEPQPKKDHIVAPPVSAEERGCVLARTMIGCGQEDGMGP